MASIELSRRQVVLGGMTAMLAGALARNASATSSPVLVELFTSQSCSSCPPAEAYLAELARQPEIVALAYHVDYWDQLGWRDPFSSAAATARQRAYARVLSLDSVYTPQMVIEGRYDAVGSDRRRVTSAIAAAAAVPPPAPVSLTAEAGALAARIGVGTGEGRAWFVVYDLRHQTLVHGGENAGRMLTNVNVVRSIDEIGRWSGAALSFTRDQPPPGAGAAVFVQSSNGAILGAAAFNNDSSQSSG